MLHHVAETTHIKRGQDPNDETLERLTNMLTTHIGSVGERQLDRRVVVVHYLPRRRRDALHHGAPLRMCIRCTLDVRADHGANYKHSMLLLPKRRVLHLERVRNIGKNLREDDKADYFGPVCRRPSRVDRRICDDRIGERGRRYVRVV